MLGTVEAGRFKVLAIEKEEHDKRAMLDGQIEDIEQVARVVRSVTNRLETKMGCRLSRVSVAAAGRALRTERARFTLALPRPQRIDTETIGRLEAGAVSEAEAALSSGEDGQRQFFLVGYTVTQYLLDHYPLATLKDHNGQELEAEVVATFLPSEVVESLYSVMRAADLEVSSLTLEPIAALNAAIPAELRLLNLVLTDIGAGTSDIAVCRDGSVVGYTMATVAGDEITEALMKEYLVDFKTAERIKAGLNRESPVSFTDILGLPQEISPEEIRSAIADALQQLAQEISRRILEVNGGAPSALFLSGGGSKLGGLREAMAQILGMDLRRVAIAGNNFSMSAFSDEYDLNDPEYTTPLGIAVSAGLGLVNDSYVITLNGQDAKLFRSGALSVLDILMMNGYTYSDFIGRTGKSLAVTVNGRRIVCHGEPSAPSQLRLNGQDVPLSTIVHAGDRIDFTPARPGQAAEKTIGDLLDPGFSGDITLNGQPAGPDAPLQTGDVVTAQGHTAPSPAPLGDEASNAPPSQRADLHITLNGNPLVLSAKADGAPYYLMDLLRFSGLDFEHLEGPVTLLVNGQSAAFAQEIKSGDIVLIQMQAPPQ